MNAAVLLANLPALNESSYNPPVNESPTIAKSRRLTLLQWSVLLACLAAFIFALSGPVADGLDRRFPSRERVAQKADPNVSLPISVADGSSDSAAVRSALAALPRAYALLNREFGGGLMIVRRADLERMHPSGSVIAHTAGLYVYEQRTAYVASDTADPGLTALHEMGHLLDHALGRLSRQNSFLTLYEALNDDPSLGQGWRQQPEEFFAELFSRYYFSDRRRAQLEERFPEAARYLLGLEARAARCSQLRCFAE